MEALQFSRLVNASTDSHARSRGRSALHYYWLRGAFVFEITSGGRGEFSWSNWSFPLSLFSFFSQGRGRGRATKSSKWSVTLKYMEQRPPAAQIKSWCNKAAAVSIDYDH